MSCWRSPAYFFSLEFFNFDVVQNIYNIQNKHLLSITISKFFTWVVWLAMILEDFCRQVTQFQVNVLSSNRYKNLWTLPILESHTAQQVRRVHRYRRYDHKITRSQTRVWFLTTTGEEERTVPIHWQKYWLVTGDYQLRPPACWLISQAYLWTLCRATPRRSDRSAQQTASLMLNAIMSGGVGISGRELYKYR